MSRRGEVRPRPKSSQPVIPNGVAGGSLLPLSPSDAHEIHQAALDVLAQTGMGDVPPVVLDALEPFSLELDETGRLKFPRALVEDTIAKARRDVVLWGHPSTKDESQRQRLDLSGTKVHVGSGGAAPMIIDHMSGQYRPSTLSDLFDAARIVDALEHMHFFCRSMVANDISDPLAFDLNTAYACLKGTAKHVVVQAGSEQSILRIADMVTALAGSAEAFREQPFLSLNVNHVVPPLRFHHESCEVVAAAARLGIPISLNSFDQVGASAPAALAGAVVQSVAETLAGLVFAHAVNPACAALFGPRPMITDLRSGAMTVGNGEQAIATAAAVQIGRFYDLPTSCIAGASDSKESDVQSGYEKALTVTLAAHAGCNFITQAGGMQAALMGVSLESYVTDNEMLGAVLRSVRGIEVDDNSLSVTEIDQIVHGDGHFLGSAATLERMNSEFLYPVLADRQSPEEWEKGGRQGMAFNARKRLEALLQRQTPGHMSPVIEQQLLERFGLELL